MKYILITKEMDQSDEKALIKLSEFFGMPKKQIESDMRYFTSGEGWNYDGFVIGETETGTSLFVGDYVVNNNGFFYKIPSELSFLIEGFFKLKKEQQISKFALAEISACSAMYGNRMKTYASACLEKIDELNQENGVNNE